jgi:hypothetical protein
LKKFLRAEREDEANFPLQIMIGKLFLYGVNGTNNVIDLPNAEKHMLLAARYTGPAENQRKRRGESFFHAALAAYLIGEEESQAGRTDAMLECLKRALTHLQLAMNAFPEFSEIHYLAAKCLVGVGREKEALTGLAILAERDPIGYSAKVAQDKDFDIIRNEVNEVFRREMARREVKRIAKLRAEREAELQAEREAERIAKKEAERRIKEEKERIAKLRAEERAQRTVAGIAWCVEKTTDYLAHIQAERQAKKEANERRVKIACAIAIIIAAVAMLLYFSGN